jgi:hypothetical protein
MRQHRRRGITISAGINHKRDLKGEVLGDVGYYETMKERG